MKQNPVKRKLRQQQATFGTWLTLDSLHSARAMARCGFDWLTLDMEHLAIDWSQAAAILGAVADAGCVPLVRVPVGDQYCIKRALDAGAWGIVVPMVDTPEQARAAIAAAKYPPQGRRSKGGGMHSLNFAATPAEYYERANDEILVVLQTESPTGVANAEAIYSLSGCDAIFIGPADLESMMRSADGRKPTVEEHEALIQQALAVAKRVGRPLGIHTMDPKEALRRAGEGMQFMAVGIDLRMMLAKAEEFVATLQAGGKAEERMSKGK